MPAIEEKCTKRFTFKLNLLLQMWGQGAGQHLGNERVFKIRPIREIQKVPDLLADQYYDLFAPMTVDYVLIEVNTGCCWSFKR